MPSVLYVGRLAKIFTSIMEGSLKKKKKSYERCDYESVDEKSLSGAKSLKTRGKKNPGTNGLIYPTMYFKDRVTLFFANNYLPEYRITMEF